MYYFKNQNAFHFLFCYYTTTNVLLFSLMHFLVKPLKSWAMIDYDEMVLLQLLHTLYNTLPVYQSTMSIYARTKREIEFLLAKQLCLAYFFYGIKYHRKEPHTYLFIRHYIYRKQEKTIEMFF